MTPPFSERIAMVDLVAQHDSIRSELHAALDRVLDHGQFILGPEVEAFEQRWAKRCEAAHAVSVSDGTMALVLTLKALGIGPGDEVITAVNSFVASASAIAIAGATPRLADVRDDLNIDPDYLRARITPRTRAIIPVHLTGRPADMDAINTIAREHDLLVIEDACQAIGATYRGQPVGAFGIAGCFSLHPLKTMGVCGDAGMITTNDASLTDKLRLLRNHGITKRQEDCGGWGHNARMDTLQAAFGLIKLDRFDDWIAIRRTHAAIYRQRLSHLACIPDDRPDDLAVYHTFPVAVGRRNGLVDWLDQHNIGCAVHYRLPIHLLPAARKLGYRQGDFPTAERLAERAISLPIHEGLREDQVHRVCDVIEEFLGVPCSDVSASMETQKSTPEVVR